MHPVAYIDLLATLACAVALAFLIFGRNRLAFVPAVSVLLAVLLALTIYYEVALLLEWSGVSTRPEWMEDFGGVLVPFGWGFLFYAFARDAVERDLKASRERMELALRGADLGTWDWNVQTDRVTFDQRWVEMLGYTSNEIRPHIKAWEQLIHPDDLPDVLDCLGRHLEGDSDLYEMEYRLRHKSAHWVWVLACGRVIDRDADGKARRVCGTHLDISARKQAEMDVMAYQRRLRALASELSLAEERERRRIAAGLHDYACQNLVLSKMKLEGLHEPLPPGDDDEIAAICHTLDRTIDSIRELTFDLSSPTLYKFGLDAALKELLEDKVKAENGIRYRFHSDDAPKPLAEDIRVLLFQSVRELVINILKHAQARTVEVDVVRLHDSMEITVTDDGMGFDADRVLANSSRTHGFGLFHMKERLDFVGGRLHIESEPGWGSRFTLHVPLDTEVLATAPPDRRSADAAEE